MDYLILPGGEAEAILIAALDGHQTGPSTAEQLTRRMLGNRPADVTAPTNRGCVD